MLILFRRLIALLALTVFAAAGLTAEPNGKVLKNGVTDGTFVRIEQGDYAHFYVKTKTNKEESFFILNPDASLQPYLDNGGKLAGRKVRVRWQERMQNLPEAGGPTRIRVVTKVDNPK